MPTPKFTPGAQLVPLSFTHPAFLGLNTETGGGIVPSQWATTLDNAVFDESGRPAARRGWTSVTSVAGTGTIKRIFEYYKADGTSEVIAATDANIYNGLTGTAASIKGTLTITDGNIMFDNFNDKAIAFGIGTGGIPTVYTGTTFADIVVSDGATLPTGGVGTAAFGRLWCADADGLTLRYSALLDETKWAVVNGGGTIDLGKVWPTGQDRIRAIREFGADLAIFGDNNTVIITDGQGSTIGLDPTNAYVSDTIPGLGAVSQFAICRAAGDLWVLTRSGLVSLNRELQSRSTSHTNISKNVQSSVVGFTSSTSDKDNITLTYNPDYNLVLLWFPEITNGFAFDTRMPMEDGAFRCTSWSGDLQTAEYIRGVNNWYGSLTTVDGEAHIYRGNQDGTADIVFNYESGWLDLGEEMNLYLKFVKRLTSFSFISQSVDVTHKVYYDFSNKSYSLVKGVSGSATAEFNHAAADGGPVAGSSIAEYNDWSTPVSTVAEYGGSVSLQTIDAPLGGGGQYIKVGLQLSTQAGEYVLQQINLYAKVGRLAT